MKSLLVMLYDINEKWVSEAAGAVPVAVHFRDYSSRTGLAFFFFSSSSFFFFLGGGGGGILSYQFTL